MPIGPIPPGCIALCAQPAEDASREVPVFSGVIQVASDCVSISSVALSSCCVTGISFTQVSSRAVGVTVDVAVDFSFDGTADGFTFHGTATATGSVFFVEVLLPTHESLRSPLDCAGTFTCTARYVGPDPVTGLQQFIVHVSGGLTCVFCPSVPYVIVRACPPVAG